MPTDPESVLSCGSSTSGSTSTPVRPSASHGPCRSNCAHVCTRRFGCMGVFRSAVSPEELAGHGTGPVWHGTGPEELAGWASEVPFVDVSTVRVRSPAHAVSASSSAHGVDSEVEAWPSAAKHEAASQTLHPLRQPLLAPTARPVGTTVPIAIATQQQHAVEAHRKMARAPTVPDSREAASAGSHAHSAVGKRRGTDGRSSSSRLNMTATKLLDIPRQARAPLLQRRGSASRPEQWGREGRAARPTPPHPKPASPPRPRNRWSNPPLALFPFCAGRPV